MSKVLIAHKSKSVVLFFLLLFFINTTVAIVSNYSFQSLSNGSFSVDKDGNQIDISTGSTLLYGSNVDSYTASLQNIGFPFYLLGSKQTQFSVNPDGQLQLGGIITGNTQSTVVNKFLIAVLNSDNKTSSTGKVHFKNFGSSPNAILVVEWKDIIISTNNISTDSSSFQIRLYENGGVIEMVYGNMFNTTSTPIDLSIGFAFGNSVGSVGTINNITTQPAFNTAATNFVTTSTSQSSSINVLNAPVESQRTVFRFSPNIPVTPTNLTFTNIGITKMTLNWNDNANNEIFYQVFRSTDGINYSLVGGAPANTTTFVQSNLAPFTTYYWRVAALYEGGLTPFITGTQATMCTMMGIKTIPGNYSSITSAIADMQSTGIGGPVYLELQSNYSPAAETYPLVLGTLPCMSAINTVTIRPALGVTGRVLTSSIYPGTIKFDGGQFWIIDGRPGGIGTQKELSVLNTNVSFSGIAIHFMNGSSNNRIQYIKANSLYCNYGFGVVFFGTTNSTGNNYNVIDNCNVDGNAGNNFDPVNASASTGIASFGNNFGPVTYNSFNMVSNCNIFNFYHHTSLSYGVVLDAGNTDWTLLNNHFYQTSNRSSGTSMGGIRISSAKNSKIYNNYIGGSTPNAGGVPWTTTGGGQRFVGISCTTDPADSVSIQGNTITNFDLSSSHNVMFQGINCVDGNYNIGNIAGNIIGSSTSVNKIRLTYTGTGGGSSDGIIVNPLTRGVIKVSNNIVGGYNLLTDAQTKSHGFSGILVFANSAQVNNNIVGSLTTTSSISAPFSISSGQNVSGIRVSTYNNFGVSGNVVSNITNNFAPSFGINYVVICGIFVSNGFGNVESNTVQNLTTSANSIDVGDWSSIIGIRVSTNATVKGNIISSLHNTHPTNAVSVMGMYCSLVGGIVNANFIHSLQATSPAALITGLEVSNGTTVQNNMIRLGIDTAGNSIQTTCTMFGIVERGENDNFYHNTVYIGGTGIGNYPSNTYAFYSYTNFNPRVYKNNIFYNARSNVFTGGKHYAFRIEDKDALTMDYNLYLASGNGGVLGFIAFYNVDMFSIAAIKSVIGQNIHSISLDPCLASPTLGIPDLHLTSCSNIGSPAESSGTFLPGVLTDFDNEIRSLLSPVDIGADGGNYGWGKDVSLISVDSPVQNTCHGGNEDIIIKFKNTASPINFMSNPVTITTNITGVINITTTKILDGTSEPSLMLTGDTLSVIAGQINTSEHGLYNISVTISISGDYDTLNNFIQHSFTSDSRSISIVGDTGIFSNDSTLLEALAGVGNDTISSYQWIYDSNIISNSSVINISDTGIYTLIATKTNGCIISKTVNVIQRDSLLISFKLFIEGFYSGNGMMDNFGTGGCLYANGISQNPYDCDTVHISIMQSEFPYTQVDQQKGVVNIDGNLSLRFNGDVYPGSSYFIKVNHRNSIETWSSAPSMFQQNSFYDFTDSHSKSYGNNLKNLGDGNFAIFSGDLNNDGVIESDDYLNMENAVSSILTGYFIMDVTGDAVVESSDYSLMENNVSSIISVMKP